VADYRQLEISDLQLQACQRWRAPDGAEFFELFNVIPFYQHVAANAVLVDVELGTPPEFEFVCKAIGYTGLTYGTLIQLQWPDGRYLQASGVDYAAFVQTGKRGRLVERPKRMPPASKLRFNIDNTGNPATAVDIELFLEGVLLVPMIQVSKAGAPGGRCILG
jgi:hypothetical protein